VGTSTEGELSGEEEEEAAPCKKVFGNISAEFINSLAKFLNSFLASEGKY
jgi:hypothetical protein